MKHPESQGVMRENEPIECGICGEGLLEKPVSSGPKEGIERIASIDQARKMKGSDKTKREAGKAWSLKIGFCEDCTKKHNLDGNSSLDKVLPKVALSRVAKIPKK